MPDIVARIVHAIDRAESLRRTNSLASATPLSVCRTSPSQTSWTSPGVETTRVASHDQVMGRPFYLLVTASNCWTVASRTTELPCTMTGNDKFWFHQRKAHKKAGELAPAATSDLSRS